jgi:hypothetical protein
VTGLSTSAVSTLVAATVMLLWYARSSLGGLLTEAFTSPDEPDLFHEPLAPEVLAAVVGSASDRTHPTEARRSVDALLAGLRPTKPQEQTTPTEVDGAKQAASSGAWGFRSSPDPSALL